MNHGTKDKKTSGKKQIAGSVSPQPASSDVPQHAALSPLELATLVSHSDPSCILADEGKQREALRKALKFVDLCANVIAEDAGVKAKRARWKSVRETQGSVVKALAEKYPKGIPLEEIVIAGGAHNQNLNEEELASVGERRPWSVLLKEEKTVLQFKFFAPPAITGPKELAARKRLIQGGFSPQAAAHYIALIKFNVRGRKAFINKANGSKPKKKRAPQRKDASGRFVTVPRKTGPSNAGQFDTQRHG